MLKQLLSNMLKFRQDGKCTVLSKMQNFLEENVSSIAHIKEHLMLHLPLSVGNMLSSTTNNMLSFHYIKNFLVYHLGSML